MVRTRNSSSLLQLRAKEQKQQQRKSQGEKVPIDDEEKSDDQLSLECLEAAATAAAVASIANDEVQAELDNDSFEAELTNLNWLQSLDITTASGLPTPPCSPAPRIHTRPPPPPKPKKPSPLLKAQLGTSRTFQFSFTSNYL